MKICVISDLHIDSNRWDWHLLDPVKEADVLVVAGDISNDIWVNCNWLKNARSMFNQVIYVAGNHDFYNLGFQQTRLYDPNQEHLWPYPSNVPEIIHHYDRWCSQEGIHFLHRQSVTIDSVTFIGATGWHDYTAGTPYTQEMQIQAWYDCLNDTVIKRGENPTPNHLNPFDAGQKDVQSIMSNLEYAEDCSVVITHHVPHKDLCWQKPHDRYWTLLHGSFANRSMEKIKNSKIKYWIYGHTHNRSMKDINGITYVCNARGYPNENRDWQPVLLHL